MSISSLASLGMAIGAPLVYADQAYSIYRKQDARGFSHDVCAVLLIANITRCVFWLGERFEFALLLQSILMIAAQLGLLYLCIRFRPVGRWSKSISSDGARVVFNAEEAEETHADAGRGTREEERDLMDLNINEGRDTQDEEEEGYANKQPLLVTLGAMFRSGNSSSDSSSYGRVSSNDPASSYSNGSSLPAPNTSSSSSSNPASRISALYSAIMPSSRSRPLNFWQWSDYNSYLVFLFLYTLLLLILYLVFSSSTTFVSLLGYLALGLESTLPIPQLIANHKRKSLAGFRSSVLLGWLGGDSFKLLYFVLRSSPAQFTVCAVLQLSVDLAILAQSRLYRQKTEEDEEQMRNKAEQRRAGASTRAREGEIEEDVSDELPARGSKPTSGRSAAAKSKAQNGKGKGSTSGSKTMTEEEDGLLQDPHHVIAIEADEDDDDGDISNGRK